jgi:hypothetical protein
MSGFPAMIELRKKNGKPECDGQPSFWGYTSSLSPDL